MIKGLNWKGSLELPLLKKGESFAVLLDSWFFSNEKILSLWALNSSSNLTKPAVKKITLINVTQQQPARRREDPLAELVIVRKAKSSNNWRYLCPELN